MYDTDTLLRLLASGLNQRPFLACKSGTEGHLFIGDAATTHTLQNGNDAESFGRHIDALSSAGKTLFGFTSYECHRGTGNSDWPLAIFCEARSVLRINDDTCQEDSSCPLDPELIALLTSAPPARPSVTTGVSDNIANWPAFLGKLRRIRDWAQADLGKYRRLTISRTIHINDDVDVAGTFMNAQPSELSRAFLFRCGQWQILGQSPELLVDGSADSFHMYKLSGTWPRSADPMQDDTLLAEMLASQKLHNEHQGSIIATEQCLRAAGHVSQGARFIQTLPELRHFVTRLDVRNDNQLGLWGLLRAASPSGAYPAAEAMALLAQLETRPRGPYYGLIGFAQGNARLEFSQTIRTLLNRGRDGWFTRVGAAVTEDSLPQQELDETRIKLSNICYRAFR